FFQAEDGIRAFHVTGVQTCALPIWFLFSGAAEAELDKQGRIMLPQTLRAHARLDKDAVVIGVSNRVEIWAKEVWDGYVQQAEGSFEDIAENLEGLGL